VRCESQDPSSIETSSHITSLAPDRTGPKELADLIRGHWGIENRIHWVRDVMFDEDRSQIRADNASRVMAILPNLAIGTLRIAGHTNIAAGIREAGRNIDRALELLGL
jgi:predicted transposase YbfD/YdcC